MSEWRTFPNSFAGPAAYDGAYRLLVTELGLEVSFIAQKVPLMLEMTQKGDYFEGLWRADCGEIWFGCIENGRYIEINLGANGAWWSCAFLSPRVRDLECTPPQCENIKTDLLGRHWQASMVVPWLEIFRCLQSEDSPVANVTLILGGCPDKNPPLENLHSIVPLGAVDFHRPQDWVPLSDLI
jgi:hypothetical protein